MKSILISAGSVYDHIDDMKIISNVSRGTSGAQYADFFASKRYRVFFLCNKLCTLPKNNGVEIVYQDGYKDYTEKVKKYSQNTDMAILSAAVCNYIPVKRFKGKIGGKNEFITLKLKLAPKVINEVKKVKKNIFLIGFKLLSGVKEKELVDAAYKVILDSHANIVVANDMRNLKEKLIIHRDKSIKRISSSEGLCNYFIELSEDRFFSTKLIDGNPKALAGKEKVNTLLNIFNKYKEKFDITLLPGDKRFLGCIAVRCKNGIITSGREKTQSSFINELSFIKSIKDYKIYAVGNKASFNSSLLWALFKNNSECEAIVHYHHEVKGITNLSYLPPGTEREAKTYGKLKHSFNIRGHGCILLLDKEGNLI